MDTRKLQTKKEEILRKEWEDDIRNRSHAKLISMLRQPDKYTEECLNFVKEVIIEKLLEATDTDRRKKTNKTTRALFLATLKKLGCSYTLDKDDGSISFAYQGAYFYATIYEDPFVCIRDYNWAVVDMKDIDDVSRVRRSVNEANMSSHVTTSYAVDDAEGELYVVSWSNFIFIPQITELTSYLRVHLNWFFRAHHVFDQYMTKLMREERDLFSTES